MKISIYNYSKKSLIIFLFLFLNLSAAINQIAPNKIRVKFSPAAVHSLQAFESNQGQKNQQGFVRTGMSSFDLLCAKHKITTLKRVFRPAGKFEARHQKYGLHLWYELEVDAKINGDIKKTIDDFKHTAGIVDAEQVYDKTLYEADNKSKLPVLSYIPNDPQYAAQWHYNNTGQTGGTPGSDIRLTEGWEIQKGSNGVIVAVIDGGIETTHQDLADAIWINTIESNGVTGVDDDNNGYIDDINGYGFGDNTGNFTAHYHGTHVAGTIGAITNNGIGVSGVAGGSGSGDGVRLMSCATFGSIGTGGFDDAFVYAADMGAVIAQNSWGYTSMGNYEQSVLDAIDYFIANAGIDITGNQTGPIAGGIVIFAAGNSSSDGNYYPGYYEPVLSVASINHTSAKAYYSNYGTWIDVAAPGGETSTNTNQGVLSALTGNSYGYLMGTSMACPHVSGLAALIVAQYGDPGITSQLVWDRIVNRTDNIDIINPGYAGKLGSGRINAYQSLVQLDSIPPAPVIDLALLDTTSSSITLTWTATGASGSVGKSSGYEIRYAQFTIDEHNFASASLAPNSPSPKPSGQIEVFELTGLRPETGYFIALKSIDIDGFESGISNVLQVITATAPVITVSPDSIYVYLPSGDSLTEPLTINNINGHNTLNYTVGINYLHNYNSPQKRDKSQDIIRTNLLPVETFDGLKVPISPNAAGFKEQPFFDGFEKGNLTDWIIDPYAGNKEVVNSSSASGQYSLYIKSQSYSNHFSGIHQEFVDSTKPNYISFNVQSGSTTTADGYFVVTFGGLDLIFFFASNNGLFYVNGNVGGDESFPYVSNTWYFVEFRDIDWISYDFDYYVDGELIKADIPMRYSAPNGMSGVYLYNFHYNSEAWWDNIQIGDEKQSWLSTDIQTGTVPAGSSQTVQVAFNAKNIAFGTKKANIVVNSNDPLNSKVTIPASMHIEGKPEITITTDTLLFKSTFTGYSDTLSITLENTGTDVLVIDSIYTTNTHFGTYSESMTLNYGESRELKVWYSANELQVDEGWLVINSNDTSNSPKIIFLKGESIEAPVITAIPDSFYAELFTGDSVVKDLHIGNRNGGSPLIASIRIYSNLVDTTTFSSSEKEPEILSSGPEKAPNIYISDVLVIQDNTSWSLSMSNYIFNEFGFYPGVINSDYISSIDFSRFKVIITTGNQSSYYYTNLSNQVSKFNEFVRNGGVVQYQTATNGYNLNIVNGVTIKYGYNEFNNLNCNPKHPILKDLPLMLSYKKANPSTSYIQYRPHPEPEIHYMNNCYFDTISLPSNAEILTTTYGSKLPTTIEYNYGFGTVIATGMTWEYLNLNSYIPGEMLYNSIKYAIRLGRAKWLKPEYTKATIAAGDSAGVHLTFDAKKMFGGDYYADIEIGSNDPANPALNIPAHLKVTGRPILTVYSDTIRFKPTFTGYSDSINVTIKNTGTDVLVIDSIYTTNNHFVVIENQLNLNYDDSILLKVRYNANEIQLDEGGLVIISNDTKHSPKSIFLSGESILIPAISFSPDSLTEYLFTAETSTQILTIFNEGEGILNFNFPEYAVSAPGMDQKIQKINVTDTIPRIEFGKDELDTRLGEVVTLGTGGPDSFGYSWIDSDNTNGPAFTWVDISSTGTIVNGLSDDNVIGPFPISFSFPFYDNTYSQFYIQSNGLISFNSGEITLSNQPIPTLDDYNNNFIAWCWDDLHPSGSSVYYQDFGDKIIIQFQNYGEFSASGKINAEVILFRTGKISLQYLNTQNGFDIYGNTVGIENSNGSDGLQVAFNTNYIHDSLTVSFSKTPEWLNLNPAFGTIAPRSSVDIEVAFDATSLYGGDYRKDITLSSNDPVNPILIVPAILHVTGKPILTLNSDTVQFGKSFSGYSDTISIRISNTGTDLLTIDSIYTINNHFGAFTDSLILEPEGSTELKVWYNANEIQLDEGGLVFISNDTFRSPKTILLLGESILPPIISVAPDSFDVSLNTGDSLLQFLTIDNTLGGSDLAFEISAIAKTNNDTINENALVNRMTKQGATNVEISEGQLSYQMNGEYENESQKFNYTISKTTILSDELTGTRILFTNSNWSAFQIELEARKAETFVFYGSLTTEILDTIDILVIDDQLYATNTEITILNNWIRNGGSILIDADEYITEKNQIIAGSGITYQSNYCQNSLTTNISEHIVTKGISSYEIYGSVGSLEVSGEALDVIRDIYGVPYCAVAELGIGKVLAIADESLYNTGTSKHLELGLNGILWLSDMKWLKIPTKRGVITAGSSIDIPVNFDATGLFGGDFYADIEISSNDPATSSMIVPTHLKVTGRPILTIDTDTVRFDQTFSEYSDTVRITIGNTGTDILEIDSMYTTNNHFGVTENKLNLNYDQFTQLKVWYNANEIQVDEGTLVLISNDTIHSPKTIHLLGESIMPPIIGVNPNAFEISLYPDDSLQQFLTINNSLGGSELKFDISTSSKANADTFNVKTLVNRITHCGARNVEISDGQLSYRLSSVSENEGIKSNFTISKTIKISNDLTGTRVLFTNKNMLAFQIELEARNARTYIFTHVTAELLDTIDILVIEDNLNASTDEITVINTWIRNGGSLLIDADQVIEEKNQIIAGSGITYIGTSNQNSLTTDISEHEITHEIAAYQIVGSAGSLQVSGNAIDVIRDVYGIPYCAVSELEKGKVLAIADESLSGEYLYYANHLQLGLNGIKWLSNKKWLRIPTKSGTIAAGSSKNIPITFDAAEMTIGDYYADISIKSNDPEHSTVSIPAHLHVIGQPVITIDSDTIGFGKLYTRYSETTNITIRNTGNDLLKIDSIYTTNNHFWVESNHLNLNSGESALLNIGYNANEIQVDEGLLFLISNDSSVIPETIYLNGESVLAPVITVTPNSLLEKLHTGDSLTKMLTIRNDGLGILNFNFQNSIDQSLTNTNYGKENPSNEIMPRIELTKGEKDTRIGNQVALSAGGPDSFGYTWIDSDEPEGPEFVWQDISTSGTLIGGLTDDNFIGPLPISFSFPFYENLYDSLYIQSNGIICFSNPFADQSNQPIPIADTKNNFIAWCWKDLMPNGAVYYQDFGNKIIIQFQNYGEFNTTGKINAEVILLSNGEIYIQYLNTQNGFNTLVNTIGIENSTGTEGLQVAFNTSYIHDNLALRFSKIPHWLTVNPEFGTIAPGTSTNIEVHFNAYRLLDGLYENDLLLNSNDPSNSYITIPVYLLVENSSSSTISPKECFSYTSPSGKYIWYSSGTHLDTIPNAAGFDSVITINLTIKPMDVRVIQDNEILRAALYHASYQWINCNAGYTDIPGENNQYFYATEDGNYAVRLDNGACIDSSTCYEVVITGLSDKEVLQGITYYPNPVENELNIEFQQTKEKVGIEILSVNGKAIIQKLYEDVKTLKMDVSTLDCGVYMVRLKTEISIATLKIVKE